MRNLVCKYPHGDAPYITFTSENPVEIIIDVAVFDPKVYDMSMQWIVSQPVQVTDIHFSNIDTVPYFSDDLPRRELYATSRMVKSPSVFIRDSSITSMSEDDLWTPYPSQDIGSAFKVSLSVGTTIKYDKIGVPCRFIKLTHTTSAESADMAIYACVR